MTSFKFATVRQRTNAIGATSRSGFLRTLIWPLAVTYASTDLADPRLLLDVDRFRLLVSDKGSGTRRADSHDR